MKIRLLKDYEARTPSGTRHIKAGMVLDLTQDKAKRLIDSGFAKAIIEGLVIKWETESGRIVYLAETQAVKESHETPGEAWFTYEEVKALGDIDREGIERVIDAKEVFPGAVVKEHVRKGVKRDEERQGKMGF